MRRFIDDILSYISDTLKNDTDISNKIKVTDAYDENSKATPPLIVVQSLGDATAQQYDTFDGEIISYVPVQITAYCQQMEIGGKTVSAKIASAIFADKIKDMFQTLKVISWNKNIKILRRVGGTPSMPTQKGTTTYFSPIRFDFYVNNEYQKIK